MKNLILILTITLFYISNVYSQDFSIEGTWRQVSMEIYQDGYITSKSINSGADQQLKSWSKNYFLFVGKTISDKGETSYAFGNGTYNLSGNHYNEEINVHVSPDYEGLKLKLHMELKNDTLIQIFPVKFDYSFDKSNCWIEKFVKVD